MIPDHGLVAIVPANDMAASTAFYRRLGLVVESDYGHYRILADARGWHLHLTYVADWPPHIEANPLGLYLYVEDVDAVADSVRELIIEPGAPHNKPWGMYEFSVSDPTGVLVRVGRPVR